MRLIEIRDEDNGFVSIGLVGIDSAVQGDPLATDGRARAIVDYTSGWQTSGSGELTDRNVRLWVEKP
jgi:hypothetical protein